MQDARHDEAVALLTQSTGPIRMVVYREHLVVKPTEQKPTSPLPAIPPRTPFSTTPVVSGQLNTSTPLTASSGAKQGFLRASQTSPVPKSISPSVSPLPPKVTTVPSTRTAVESSIFSSAKSSFLNQGVQPTTTTAPPTLASWYRPSTTSSYTCATTTSPSSINYPRAPTTTTSSRGSYTRPSYSVTRPSSASKAVPGASRSSLMNRLDPKDYFKIEV